MSTRNRNLPPPVEPDLPELDPASQASINNALADVDANYAQPMTDEYMDTAPEDVINGLDEPEEIRRAEPVPQGGTGTRFDFSAFEPIVAAVGAGDMETARKLKAQLSPVQQHVLERASYTEEYTAEDAARDANAFMDLQTKAQMQAQANTPQAQVDLADKKAAAAAKQAEMQQQYLQEVQYQRHIATLNNTNATKAERAAAINSIDGLAASIGQRMIKGTSTASVADAKRLVGTVSSRIPVLGINVQEYNPMADYGPQLEAMLSGSQERMGVLRQQMESSGIPLPEAKQVEAAMNPSAPDMFELSVQRLGVKAADGSQVMLNGAPVIRRKDGTLFKAMPNGKGVQLTEQEIAQLGQ